MALMMDYDSMYLAIESWEMLRRIENHEEVVGSKLFQRLFEKCPDTKVLFGYPIDMDTKSEEMINSKRFLRQGSYLIQMLDKAMHMLGPDIELLEGVMEDLGKKHARFGVKEEYFAFMEVALVETLEEVLADDFDEAVKDAWKVVYGALSSEMFKAMNKEKLVIESWDKLKQVPNYEEKAGSLLFQRMFEQCPETKTLFGFPKDMDPQSDEMLTSRRFKMHSTYFITMFDEALNMLEKDKLDDNLSNLGKIHSMFNVKEKYFPYMGEALIYTLSNLLSELFQQKQELKEAWTGVYDKLSSKIILAMKSV